MRVALLSAVNIKHMAMLSIYQDFLRRHEIPFDLIYMDKYDIEESFDCDNIYRFVNVIDHDLPRKIKIAKYFRFRKYARKILEKNKYDFIIVWNDVAINMFSDYLNRKWKNKYCLNIRDTQKKKPLYKRWFQFATDNCAFATVSSDAYLPYLPKRDYLLIHSYNKSMTEQCIERTSFRAENEPIRISFVGKVRFFDYNKKLLDVFKNDERFVLGYYGIQSDVLKQYAEENGITNVDFVGEFPMEDTWKYIDRTDIINNFYGNDTVNRRTALSQKLYYGTALKLPILATGNTYTADLVDEYQLGIVVDKIDETMPDKVYQWYRNQKFEEFSENSERFMDSVHKSHEIFEELCLKYMK